MKYFVPELLVQQTPLHPWASCQRPECSVFSVINKNEIIPQQHQQVTNRQRWFKFSIGDLSQTLRSSLRSDTSNKVRLAMSLTSCWILGEYCLGAPSSGGVAMASEWVAGLVFRSLRVHKDGACRWSCCLKMSKKGSSYTTACDCRRSVQRNGKRDN